MTPSSSSPPRPNSFSPQSQALHGTPESPARTNAWPRKLHRTLRVTCRRFRRPQVGQVLSLLISADTSVEPSLQRCQTPRFQLHLESSAHSVECNEQEASRSFDPQWSNRTNISLFDDPKRFAARNENIWPSFASQTDNSCPQSRSIASLCPGVAFARESCKARFASPAEGFDCRRLDKSLFSAWSFRVLA